MSGRCVEHDLAGVATLEPLIDSQGHGVSVHRGSGPFEGEGRPGQLLDAEHDARRHRILTGRVQLQGRSGGNRVGPTTGEGDHAPNGQDERGSGRDAHEPAVGLLFRPGFGLFYDWCAHDALQELSGRWFCVHALVHRIETG